MIVVQCQSMIPESGICKQKLRKIDKDWAQNDKNGDNDTIFERFKSYYITETAILVADEVQSITNQANSAMEQKITDLQDIVSKLHNNNSVLMTNQEEMTSIYKNDGVPIEITTGGGRGTSVAPGQDLAAYIRQFLDESTANNNCSNKRSSGGDTNRNVDTKKERVEITWWRQFKYYCPSCGVNLHYGARKCPRQKRMKGHDDNITWEKKETPRNKERFDRLWM